MQKTVWYSFTPKSSLNIDVDTIGSDYDTVLAVYETSPGANTEQACDDGAAGLASAIYDLPLVGGTTYYFQVGGYGYASGKLRFNLQESA